MPDATIRAVPSPLPHLPPAPSSGRSSRLGPFLALLYLYIPFLLFAIGWMRPVFSVPIVVLTALCLPHCYRVLPALWVPECTRRNLLAAFLCAAILAVWLYGSGVGGFVWANHDHLHRNTIFGLLVERPWPVTSAGVEGVPQDAPTRLLCYYVGFWLPAAAVAKATSLRIGFFAQWVWAYAGILLACYLLFARFRRIPVWAVLVFILYSGADSLGVALKNMHSAHPIPFWDWESHFENWAIYQYSAMTTQLYWVYNQAIPVWVATALLLDGIPDRIVLFVAACLMVSSTLPFVGFCALAAFFALDRHLAGASEEMGHGRPHLGQFIRSFVSVPNAVGVLCIGLPSFLFLTGNSAGAARCLFWWWTYPFFILAELVLPMLPLWLGGRRDRAFWFVFLSLLALPFFKIGPSVDICMRVSIPFLFVVMVWTMDTLLAARRPGDRLPRALLLAVLALGAFTPLHEISRTVVNVRRHPDAAAYYAEANTGRDQIFGYRLEDGNVPVVYINPSPDSFFPRVLARRPANHRKAPDNSGKSPPGKSLADGVSP